LVIIGMMRFLAGLVLLALVSPQREEAMQVAAVRFFSPATGTTVVEGTAEVRLDSLLAGAASGRYRVEIAVRDSAGLELFRNAWDREVPVDAARRGASAVESFSFSAAPGLYRVQVRAARDGAAIERDIAVRAFPARPVASDLLLASRVRQPAADSETLAPGEVRRAGLVMLTGPTPRVSPTEPMLAYYAELYPQVAVARGELSAEVVAAGGRVVVRTPARTLEVGSAGGLSRGSLDLTGLPEGTYRLRLRVRLGDSTVVSEAPFAMGSLAAALAAEAAPVAPVRAEDQLIDAASDAGVDSLFAPMMYLLGPDEYRVYGTLAPEGRRRFLKLAWQRRDPTPQTADNPVMAEFYRAVAYVNEAYRESGRGSREGWRTDRGRIYLRYGRPSEVLSRPSASEPYEVWKYTRDRVLYYVFLDRSGFSVYNLIGTNDRSETGQMDWERRVDREMLQEVMQFIR
jgi:GWxTD domain-containing protein